MVGAGKRLFGDGLDEKSLKLVGAETLASGVVLLTHRPAGRDDEAGGNA